MFTLTAKEAWATRREKEKAAACEGGSWGSSLGFTFDLARVKRSRACVRGGWTARAARLGRRLVCAAGARESCRVRTVSESVACVRAAAALGHFAHREGWHALTASIHGSQWDNESCLLPSLTRDTPRGAGAGPAGCACGEPQPVPACLPSTHDHLRRRALSAGGL